MAQAAIGQVSANQDIAGIFDAPGMVMGTPVMTLDGEMPVEYLAPGDRVLTRGGMRRLSSIEVTSVQNARVVHIVRDSLGVGRPVESITVSPAQQVLLRDWRAKALFGKAEALISAARLADGEYVRVEILPNARFFTLRFETAEVIYAGGVELSCTPVPVTA